MRIRKVCCNQKQLPPEMLGTPADGKLCFTVWKGMKGPLKLQPLQ